MRTIAAKQGSKVNGRSLWRKALACAMSVVLVSGITMPGAFTALAAQAGDPSGSGGTMFTAGNLNALEDSHDFTYSASGATITAICGNDDCALAEKTATLTISAVGGTYNGETVYGATLTNAPSDSGLALEGAAQIQYQKKTGEDSWGEATAAAPKAAGTYKASITLTNVKTGTDESGDVPVSITGDVTAFVVYEIAKATPTYESPTGLTAEYGQTLADVALSNPDGNTPGTWAWVDDTVPVGDIGTNSFSAQYTPTDTANYATPEFSEFLQVTVEKATPIVTTPPTASGIAYGQTLASSTLSDGAASASSTPVAGAFAWTDDTIAPAVSDSGTTPYDVTFTPTDGTHYNTATSQTTLTVGKGTPKADAPTGLTATYGQTLADVALTNPDGNTDGTWAWVEDTSTSVGNAGTHTFHADFTPTDADNYNPANNVEVEISVGKATPTVTTAPAASGITYGQTLADSELSGGEASVAGTFAWSNTATAPPASNGSNAEYEVTFTPTDTSNYNTTTCQVEVAVDKASPTAAAPTGVTAASGQTLADVELINPEGNTPGTWAWVDDGTTPVGDVGIHTFKANFTPADAANYNSASNVDVQITVSGVVPDITTLPTASAITYGHSLSASTLEGGVAKHGDTFILGTWAWKDGTIKPSVSDSNTTEYDVVFSPDDTADYHAVTVKVKLEVAKADPIYNVPTGLTATYGQTLADVTLTNPEGNTPGTWAWSQPGDTPVGDAGGAQHLANFTPDDTDNYKTETGVGLVIAIDKATPTVTTAPAASGITYRQTLASSTLSGGVASLKNTPVAGAFAWTDGTIAPAVSDSESTLYDVTFTPSDTRNYNTATCQVALKVDKANPTANAPTGLTATYGQMLASVGMSNPQGNTPGSWAWAEEASTTVGNAGTNTFHADFTPNDTDNYNSATNVEVQVTVDKADPTANAPTGATATVGQTLADVELTNPDGNTPGTWAWVDSTTSVGIVGTHAFKANFTPTDADNYNSANNVDVQVTVSGVAPTITTPPTASGITYGQKLANSTLSGGVASVASTPVEGTFAWANDAVVPTVADSNVTDYDVIFTPTDTQSYSTATCKVKLAVAMADPTANAPIGLTATYGQTLANVTLTNPDGNTPGEWVWVEADTTSVGNVGSNTFHANFTPTDTANYNEANNIEVQITVGKATPTVTTAPAASGITYGQTLADSTLSGGAASVEGAFAWTDGTVAPAVADSNITPYDVTFTPTDSANYNTATCTATLAVEKADPTANAPTGVTAAYGQTLAGVALPNPAGNTPGEWAWANSAASVGEIGTHTFKANFTPTSTANYNSVTGIDVSVTVGPKDANSDDITAAQKSGETLTYNSAAKAPTLVVKDGEVPIVTYSVTYEGHDGTTYGPSGTAPTKAGDYTATLDFTGNYAGKRTVDFVVNPKPVTVSGLTVESKTYDGTAKATIDTSGATITGLVDGDDVAVDSATGAFDNANAGADKAVTVSDIELSGSDAGNYTASSEDLTGTITKATGTATSAQKPTAKEGLVYNGADQALVSAPSSLPEGYTKVQYSIDGGETWTDEVPTGKNAGTYTVEVNYVGDANHNDFAGDDISVKISSSKEDNIKTEVVVTDGAPEVSISNFDKVAASTLTDAEKAAVEEGATAKVCLEVSKLDSKTIPAADKSALEAAAKKLGATPAVWMDLSLWKQVTGFSKTAVHELSVPAKLTLGIPESLRKENRTFYLIRLHDEGTKTVAEGTGDEISGESDLFSTYLLAYKDSTTKGTSGNSSSAKTGDALPIVPLLIVVVAAAGLALLAAVLLRRRQSESADEHSEQ